MPCRRHETLRTRRETSLSGQAAQENHELRAISQAVYQNGQSAQAPHAAIYSLLHVVAQDNIDLHRRLNAWDAAHPQTIDERRLRLHRDTEGERGHLAPQSSHAADNPSIVWVQRERGLRLTRVRGVPLAGEALGVGDLLGSIGCRDRIFTFLCLLRLQEKCPQLSHCGHPCFIGIST